MIGGFALLMIVFVMTQRNSCYDSGFRENLGNSHQFVIEKNHLVVEGIPE